MSKFIIVHEKKNEIAINCDHIQYILNDNVHNSAIIRLESQISPSRTSLIITNESFVEVMTMLAEIGSVHYSK